MSAILTTGREWGALALAAVFTFLLARAYWKDRSARIAQEEDDIRSYDEQAEKAFNDALNNKISEAAAQRVSDALNMVATMKTANDVLLEAARTYTDAEAAVKRVETIATESAKNYARLAEALDSLDRNQGAILAALHNMGLMGVADLTNSRQQGEPASRVPPLRTDRRRTTGATEDAMIR